MHYRPIGWNLTRDDARVAIPPYWADGLDTTATAPAPRPETDEEPPMTVTFWNHLNTPIQLFWTQPNGTSFGAEN